MEILKLLSMKRVFNYVLLVCVMFVLAACGTTKKTQTNPIKTHNRVIPKKYVSKIARIK